MQIQPVTFIDLTLDYHIWHIGLSPWEDVYSWSRYNFDIKVKFIGFLTWDCVWTIAFLSVLWHSHTIFCTRLISMGRCVTYIYDFDLWSQYQNCIFHYEFASGQNHQVHRYVPVLERNKGSDFNQIGVFIIYMYMYKKVFGLRVGTTEILTMIGVKNCHLSLIIKLSKLICLLFM